MLRPFYFHKALLISLAGVLCLPSHSFAVEEAAMLSSNQSQMVQSSIRDRVIALRQQRRQQMPYLNKNIIDSTISPEKVQKRVLFVSDGKKNLSSLIDRAASVHTPAKTARERISLAKRRILVAARNLFPEARFEWEDRKGRLSGRPFNNMTYQVAFRQPLFRGGILWNTLLQEKAGLEVARKEYDAALSDLIADVSAAYFEYNRSKQIQWDQEAILEKAKRFTDISQQKFNEGIVSEIENLNVQSLYSQIQYDYETAKQEIEIAKLELQRFLDVDLQEDISLEVMYDLQDVLSSYQEDQGLDSLSIDQGDHEFAGDLQVPGLEDLVDMAYQHRPELRVESSRLDSARLEERVRWGELLPHADLVFEFGRTGEAFDDISRDPALREDFRLQLELGWNVMGSNVDYTFEHNEQSPSVSQFLSGTGSDFSRNNIGVGVLDGLQALADAKEAEVEKLEQIEELEETEKEIVLDVKQSFYDYQKARIQVRSSIQRVNYRKRLLSLSEFRLEKNEIEISEYLQAEIDLLNELSALHGALADYFTAKSQLNHAIGLSNHFEIEDNYEF